MNKSRLRSCRVETVLIATAAYALVRQGRTSPPYDSPIGESSHRRRKINEMTGRHAISMHAVLRDGKRTAETENVVLRAKGGIRTA